MGVSGAPRIGVLGGTFDPPHLAHLVLAAAARGSLRLDRVLLVPAGEPWRKAGREVSPPEARLRLVEAAAGALPWAEVSAVEVERPGPSYAVETLEALAAAEPDAARWFLLGEDALADLPRWRDPRRLIALARFGLARRAEGDGGGEPPEVAAAYEALPGLRGRVDPVPMPRLAISASDLRGRVRRGEPTSPLLPAAVRRLADEMGLYR